MSETILLWLLVAVGVLLLARLLVFQASCALMDIQPNLIKSFVLPGVFWLGMVLLAWLLAVLLVPPEWLAWLGASASSDLSRAAALPWPSLWLVLGLTVLGIAIVSWPVYLLTLPTSVKKSALIAGIEQLLLALLAGLITACVMIGLALWQITTAKPG